MVEALAEWGARRDGGGNAFAVAPMRWRCGAVKCTAHRRMLWWRAVIAHGEQNHGTS
jgi:hypothetical protein